MIEVSEFEGLGVSAHRALCWLVREAVDLRLKDGQSAKGRYKRAYREAEDALKAKGLAFQPLDGARLDMLVAKPNAVLPEAEARTLGLIAGELMADLGETEARVLKARAVERAKTQPGSRARRAAAADGAGGADAEPSRAFAELYRGAMRYRQELLADLAGDYLIFRHFHRPGSTGHPTLIVSHMTVTPSADGKGPARFRTLGAGSGKDERVVEGFLYEANAAHGLLFSVGREVETAQIRNALLEPVAKPVPGCALSTGRRDLKGMRLAVSRFTGDPRAYRIWCAAVDGTAPDGGDWRGLVKDYMDGEPLDAFAAGVPGFGYIQAWLGRPVVCVLDEDGDPPTP